jgi:hypothetical protein
MKYVHNAATIAGAIVAEILNHPSEGFALQAPQYGGTKAARIDMRQIWEREFGMNNQKLVKILLLCLVAIAIASFVAGLPWGDSATRAFTKL